MKNRLLSVFLSVLMVFSVCCACFVSAEVAYSFTEDTTKAYQVTTGVKYREFTLSSGVHDASVSSSVLEFNTDDYMVMSYAGVAGGAATLDKQFQLAKNEGYDVVAIINGDFFSMDTAKNGNYGYLNEYVVSGGVIVCADNDNPAGDFDGAVAIGPDGSISSTMKSMLHFNMYFNGKEVNGGLACVNKTMGNSSASNWSDRFYYFDKHSGDKYDEDSVSKALTYEVCPGYEVLCKKLNGTDLTINGTLEAKVVSVKENAYGGEIGDDEFILFVKADSSFAYQAAALKAGDNVSISAAETNVEAASVTEGAVSVMANVGYLVKNGVDLTKTASTIGSHSVTLQARWTAFGKKADGSWVFFTSEGGSTGSSGSPTLKDVAKAMIELGCTDVIRMDGGGSSAMYVCDNGTGVPGFKQSSSRAVGDCILVVRRSSEALQVPADLKNDLNDLVAQAQTSENEEVQVALMDVLPIINDENAVKGQYLTAFMKLRYALSGKKQLGDMMSLVSGVKFQEYSEFILTQLREAYAEASSAFGGVSTPEEVQSIYEKLKDLYESKGDVTVDGKEYKKISTGIFLTGLNLSILTDYSCIYTPGTDVSKVNLNWAQVILVRWSDEEGAYVVEQNFFGNGAPATIFKKLGFTEVPDDCLVFGVHGDSSTGATNRNIASKAKKGQVLNLYGIDVENKTTGVGSYFEFVDPTPKFAPGDINGDGNLNAFDYQMVKAYVLGTYSSATAEQISRMNVNGDSSVNAFDYQMIKAAVLGTYSFT